MQRFTHKVTNPGGLHIRHAGMIVKLDKQFASRIAITKDADCVMANRPAALLGLKIKKGDLLTVSVEGEDEEQAAQKIRAYFCENL